MRIEDTPTLPLNTRLENRDRTRIPSQSIHPTAHVRHYVIQPSHVTSVKNHFMETPKRRIAIRARQRAAAIYRIFRLIKKS